MTWLSKAMLNRIEVYTSYRGGQIYNRILLLYVLMLSSLDGMDMYYNCYIDTFERIISPLKMLHSQYFTTNLCGRLLRLIKS